MRGVITGAERDALAAATRHRQLHLRRAAALFAWVAIIWTPAAYARPVAFVTSAAGVSIIDVASHSIHATLPIGAAQSLAISPDGTRLFIGIRDGASRFAVAVVQTDTLATVATIPVPGLPYSITVTPDGNRLWVWHHRVCRSDTDCIGVVGTSVLDVETRDVIATLRADNNAVAGGVALTNHGALANVFAGAGSVVTIDTSTYAVIDEKYLICCIQPPIVAHPDDRSVYVLGNEFGGFLGIIDTQSSSPNGDFVFLFGQGPELNFQNDIVFSKSGALAYLSGSRWQKGQQRGALFIFDTAERRVLNTVDVDHLPAHVALSGDERFVYVANRDVATLSVIELDSGQVQTEIALSAPAQGIVFGDSAFQAAPLPSPTPTIGCAVCDGRSCSLSDGSGGNCLIRPNGCECVPEVTPSATPSPTPLQMCPTTPIPCTGDCNGDRQVTIDELTIGVNMVLGAAAPLTCTAFCNTRCGPGPRAGHPPSVDCIVRAVAYALDGCAATPCSTDNECSDGNACTVDQCSTAGCTSMCVCL
jgi:DNA-binding beta-propeller fold protein YncE